jgi:hypothetical protein
MAVTIEEVDVEVTERPAAREEAASSSPRRRPQDLASALQRMRERRDRLEAD